MNHSLKSYSRALRRDVAGVRMAKPGCRFASMSRLTGLELGFCFNHETGFSLSRRQQLEYYSSEHLRFFNVTPHLHVPARSVAR